MSTAILEVQGRGTIELELYAKDCPVTVGNFIKLAKEGFYDGLTFHRVIGNFMVQFGCPNSRPGSKGIPGTGGPGYKFADEASALAKPHDGPGVLSMANAGPNTNGSQFFITHLATPHLNGMHGVFGKVTKGMEVINAVRQGDVMAKVTIKEAEVAKPAEIAKAKAPKAPKAKAPKSPASKAKAPKRSPGKKA